jgi:uncharacterized membrane protein YgcG
MEIRTASSRRRLFSRRPSPRKGESFIATYDFPAHIERGVRRKHPELTDEDWAEVERGLREWLICCAWRGGATLAMPSRIVDEAWHQFILDSASYIGFCNRAYGEYLHHIPEGDEALEPADGEVHTVHAWDRSKVGQRKGESVMWDLDERLRIADPLGIPVALRHQARASYAHAGGGGLLIDNGDGGGSDTGGASGGGGCGGGGCGGGGCGGGGG